MPHRPWLCISLAFASTLGCSKDKLEGPKAEVHPPDVKADLPPVPAFDMPAASSDGSHAVKELRVKGKKLFDTEITVKGIVLQVKDRNAPFRRLQIAMQDHLGAFLTL